MKSLKRVFVLLVTVLVFNVSCSSNDNAVSDLCKDYETNVIAAAAKFSDAYSIQYQNPSTENCNTLKIETQNFINFLEGAYDCIPDSEQAEMDKYINELKEELDTVCD